MDVKIKVAALSDAKEIAKVIRSSIKACIQDHQNDEKLLEGWLANKTQNNVKEWLETHHIYIATSHDKIIGVIMYARFGEILLNYVLPTLQGHGIGKAMLNAVKVDATEKNLTELYLESTLTAKDFYLSQGFNIIAQVTDNARMIGYEMSYQL